MANSKRSEQQPVSSQPRAKKFLDAQLALSDQKYREFIRTLDPRERILLAGDGALD